MKKLRYTYYDSLNNQSNKGSAEYNQEYYDNLANQAKELYENADINYICDGLNTIEPLTVGIFAEWGMGKTRLLKEIKQEILRHNEELKRLYPEAKELTGKEYYEKSVIIPIFFNAWRFEKEEHIIIPLFKTLIEAVNQSEHIEFKDKIYAKLKVLSMALFANLQFSAEGFSKIDFGKLFSGDITQLKHISNFFNFKGISQELNRDEIIDAVFQSGHIDTLYLNISQWIEKIVLLDNVKFLFLIDDLDRCLPENSIKMLESIKLFLDVPGCSFVLALDDDIIERGIEHHYKEYRLDKNEQNITINSCHNKEQNAQNSEPETKNYKENKQNNTHLITNNNKRTKPQAPITGNEYLEKIVQLPFRIPPFDTTDVKKLLKDDFEEIFIVENKNKDEDNLAKQYPKENIKQSSTKESIDKEFLNFFANSTPPIARKIIRVANLYLLKKSLIEEFDNNIDKYLIAKLTLLELFAPKIYRFMKNNNFIDNTYRVISWLDNENIKSLKETNKIEQDISTKKMPQAEEEKALHLLHLIRENNSSRVGFNLDVVFSNISKDTIEEKLDFYIKLKAINITKIATIKESAKSYEPANIELFEEYIFSNDELSWQKAFEQDENLKDNYLMLYDGFIEKAKELSSNPKWLKVVAKHLSKQDFLKLIEETKPFQRLLNEK